MRKDAVGRVGREPITYEIVVMGELGAEIGMLEGMTVTVRAGRSTISGDIVDQAHLYGVLEWLARMGIELVSVRSEKNSPGDSRGTA